MPYQNKIENGFITRLPMDTIDYQKAIFLDRDGVIIKDLGYVYKPKDLYFLPHAIDGLLKLKRLGFLLIVISNQSGVARGLFTIEDVEKFNAYMTNKLLMHGVKLDAIYFCPHHPDGIIPEFKIQCSCRKPNISLLLKAKQDFNIKLEDSYIIGDKDSDITTGLNANLKGCIQIINEGSNYPKHTKANFYADDLLKAYEYIKNIENQAN